MKISEIMTVHSVFCDVKASNKRQLLQDLSKKAAEITGIFDRTIFDSLLERENLGSTGFGGATALPHARIPEAKKVYGFLAKLTNLVDYEAVDEKPVDLVFMLISPEDSGADHLTALAKASRILKDEAFCNKLRQVSGKEEIYALLNNHE